MKRFRAGWAAALSVSVAVVAAIGARASGEVIKVVTPSSAMDVEGNLNRAVGSAPVRIQFLYLASDFAQLPASHRQIVGYNFRADVTQNQPNDWTFPDQEVWMSTTSRTTLTNVFADNHGANRTLVFDGSAVYPLVATGPAAGPNDFADGTPLQTPFSYDPSQGNLLVEQLTFVGSSLPNPIIDIQSAAGARTLVRDGSPNSITTGDLLSTVPVMQFEFVPEPSTFVLAGAGLAPIGLLAWRRKRGGLRRRGGSGQELDRHGDHKQRRGRGQCG